MITLYIYANGCSMTYGSELHDDPVTKKCTNSRYRWEHSWPGELGRLVDGSGVYNDSMPSGSNERIVRTTVDFISSRWLASNLPPPKLLVVIGWSHPHRREFFVQGSYRQVVPHHDYDIDQLNRLVRVYRKVAYDEVDARWRFAINALTLAGFLRSCGVRYHFFDAIETNRLPDELAGGPDTRKLLGSDYFDSIHGDGDFSMAGFLRNDPLNWTGQHPSEGGHSKWAAVLAAAFPPDQPEGPADQDLKASGLPRLGGTCAVQRHDVKEADRAGMRPLSRYRWLSRGKRAGTSARDPFLYP